MLYSCERPPGANQVDSFQMVVNIKGKHELTAAAKRGKFLAKFREQMILTQRSIFFSVILLELS